MIQKEYVFHGSNKLIEIAIPKKHRRTIKTIDGEKLVKFNDVSFHATSYKWIALAYTYSVASFTHNDKEVYYNVGIDLYKNKKEIEIYGYKSLEKSLQILYGNGGYLHKFRSEDFFHTKGLGTLELITQKNLSPLSIRFYNDPVNELQKQEITFKFIDLSLQKNKHYRNYKEKVFEKTD